MRRSAVIALHAITPVLLVATLSACGSGSDEEASPDADATSSAAATPSDDGADASYFTDDDTKALNAAAAAAARTGRQASVPRQLRRCNAQGEAGYQQWRACWHGLLDPYVTGLAEVSTELDALSGGEFGQECRDQATQAAQSFDAFATAVEGLLEMIDSPRRGQQVAAMRTYSTTLEEVGTDFGKPFEELTQACYSPERLAELEATASATP